MILLFGNNFFTVSIQVLGFFFQDRIRLGHASFAHQIKQICLEVSQRLLERFYGISSFMMKLGSPLHDRVETIEYLVVKKGKVAEMKPKPIFLLTRSLHQYFGHCTSKNFSNMICGMMPVWKRRNMLISEKDVVSP